MVHSEKWPTFEWLHKCHFTSSPPLTFNDILSATRIVSWHCVEAGGVRLVFGISWVVIIPRSWTDSAGGMEGPWGGWEKTPANPWEVCQLDEETDRFTFTCSCSFRELHSNMALEKLRETALHHLYYMYTWSGCVNFDMWVSIFLIFADGFIRAWLVFLNKFEQKKTLPTVCKPTDQLVFRFVYLHGH